MLEFALLLICAATFMQSSRHWAVVSRELYEEYNETRLKSHLNWSNGHVQHMRRRA